MCGIIGIVGKRPVTERLVRGLQRLEYRGYDSAGVAISGDGVLKRSRAKGKIAALRDKLKASPIDAHTGIAHTRWATHGVPEERNAHPHQAGDVAIVHNGIIENFQALRAELEAKGAYFESETDSETIAQLLSAEMKAGADPVTAFRTVLPRLTGAFAIAAIFAGDEQLMIGARQGSPLVLGHGTGEMFLGSDAVALAPYTRQVVYLEEGDWVVARPDGADVFNADNEPVERPVVQSAVSAAMAEKGNYAHFMQKEIHEQAESISRSLAPYVDTQSQEILMEGSVADIFAGATRAVAIGCGTAYYAACVAKYWFEQVARLGLETDIASEYRYRQPVLPERGPALFVSQSGETADTLAALRHCADGGLSTLGVVNVRESTIAREAHAIVPTTAGPEIGVASTKAFTAQLSVLAALAVGAARVRGVIDEATEATHVADLMSLPRLVSETLKLEPETIEIAKAIAPARDVLYLGRGVFYPIALEGALKLKEISYAHAEGYAAGELKHGPIALIEDGVPVIVIAPEDELMEKTLSNMQEVRARGAKVILITDAAGVASAGSSADHVLEIPSAGLLAAPILATIPIQLIAYHAAVARGTDVDQPRNLAKSVTVE